MSSKIPQIIPLCGRTVKVDYQNIQKLCNRCFGPHFRKNCKSELKVQWPEYVESFMTKHPDLPVELFGLRTEQNQGKKAEPAPTLAQFGVPKTKEEYNEFIIELMKTGMDYKSATADIYKRNVDYKEAEMQRSFIVKQINHDYPPMGCILLTH